MLPDKNHLEELTRFIRQYRSDEANFEKLYERLAAECALLTESNRPPDSYADSLHQTLNTQAATYKENKEKGISAWPDFENFVTHFEKAVVKALHQGI